MPLDDSLIEVGNAIVAELEAQAEEGTWPSAFDAERVWVPNFELGEDQQANLEKTKVFVVPMSDTADDAARELEEFECTVDIGATAHVRNLAENGDELVRLTGAIRRHFRRWRKDLDNGRSILVTAHERLIGAAPQHLEQFGVMTTVVRLTVSLIDPV